MLDSCASIRFLVRRYDGHTSRTFAIDQTPNRVAGVRFVMRQLAVGSRQLLCARGERFVAGRGFRRAAQMEKRARI